MGLFVLEKQLINNQNDVYIKRKVSHPRMCRMRRLSRFANMAQDHSIEINDLAEEINLTLTPGREAAVLWAYFPENDDIANNSVEIFRALDQSGLNFTMVIIEQNRVGLKLDNDVANEACKVLQKLGVSTSVIHNCTSILIGGIAQGSALELITMFTEGFAQAAIPILRLLDAGDSVEIVIEACYSETAFRLLQNKLDT